MHNPRQRLLKLEHKVNLQGHLQKLAVHYPKLQHHRQQLPQPLGLLHLLEALHPEHHLLVPQAQEPPLQVHQEHLHQVPQALPANLLPKLHNLWHRLPQHKLPP